MALATETVQLFLSAISRDRGGERDKKKTLKERKIRLSETPPPWTNRLTLERWNVEPRTSN